MANNDTIARIRERMEVRSSDGVDLGKVRHIYYGSDLSGELIAGSEEETCIEVHRGLLRGDTIYVPRRAVADVTERGVTLGVSAEVARSNPSWHHKPAWAEE